MDKESASNQEGIKEENKSEQGSVEQSRSIAEEQVGSVAVSSRQLFARLTREEQDFTEARTIQEQERAFRSLAWGGMESDDDDDDDNHDEDGASGPEDDENIIDRSQHPDDESYAPALGEANDERPFRWLGVGGSGIDEDNENMIGRSQFPDDESYVRAVQEAYAIGMDGWDSDIHLCMVSLMLTTTCLTGKWWC